MATTTVPPRTGTRPSRASSQAPRRRIFNHEMYELAFGTVYTGLVTNVLVVLAALPLVVLLLTTDPAASWPALVLLAPFCAPAVVAAFAVFRAFSADGSVQPVRTFWRGYRTHWRRAVALGALTTGLLVVVAVDVRAVWGLPVGAVAIPFFVTLGALGLVTALVATVALPDHPTLRLRELLRVSLFAGVRRWYLTAPSLLVLGMLVSLVATRPAVGLGLALAPLLFVAWGAARHALRSVLERNP
ncbi:DUF624 domain-containing protein [Cellulosimicrobium protaetiae]|uniref:DUF624 domain-containing protein n=1 Tax=Cellulosimicrobium protaetiae TaxID=2587808 RepID=A0A6M5UGH8_9MICO|nr:DUF624 domain-containing protein [Cellulosimicrobium protaetiae]QJW36722.1 DUF624 domain-containing protein [Cellulosimicrobium protaetiae]